MAILRPRVILTFQSSGTGMLTMTTSVLVPVSAGSQSRLGPTYMTFKTTRVR